MELTTLRNATETHHRKIEQTLDVLRSSFTRAHYIALLKQFYGFHQPWESAVSALLESELPGFFAPRSKLQNIESDLLYLGASIEDLPRIPKCCRLPALQSVGSVLGSVYVIEGSTLGGRILTRHFSEHLGLQPDAGCRYFAGYGQRTGHMWSAFAELMAARPPAENTDMLEAAVATFDLLGNWLGNESRA